MIRGDGGWGRKDFLKMRKIERGIERLISNEFERSVYGV